MRDLNEDTFEGMIGPEGTVLVDFWAPWCGPCRMLLPTLAEVEAENKDIIFVKINVDDNMALALRYKITSVPTVIVFKDGKETGRFSGVQGKEEIQELLNV